MRRQLAVVGMICAMACCVVRGDEGKPSPASIAEKHYRVAVQRANEAYAKMLLAADKTYLAEIDKAAANATGDNAESLRQSRAALVIDASDREQIQKATSPLRPPAPEKPSDAAPASPSITKGMTVEQVSKIMGKPVKTVANSDGTKDMTWRRSAGGQQIGDGPGHIAAEIHTVRATIDANGKVTDFSDTSEER